MTHPSQQTGTDPGTVFGRIGRAWGWVLAFGVLTLLAGIAVLVWPGPTLVLVALIIGVQLVVAGVFQFVRAFTTHGLEGGTRVLLGVLAVLSFLAGIILLRHPFATVAVLALVLGLFWVVSGVIETFHGIAERHLPGRGLVITTGVLGVLAGIAVLAFPLGSLVALTWLFGAWLVVYGV
ncbi:MAG: HdeD family acid-resistance protein, partial [Nocardioidaceae bacterium]